MPVRMFAAVLMSLSFICAASAAPATRPATAPAAAKATAEKTKAIDKVAADTKATADATTRPANPDKPAAGTSAAPEKAPSAAKATPSDSEPAFPTPAELMEQLRNRQKQIDAMPKVAMIDLMGPVREKPADFAFFAQAATTFHDLIVRVRRAVDDKTVRALLIKMTDVHLTLTQANELRDELAAARKAGKKVFVYADSYDTISYTVAAAATNVCILDGGAIFMPGVAVQAMFLKGTLDKLGIHADFVQIGEYKGADEQLTRSTASDEMKGELNRLVDAYYTSLVDGISLHRGIAASAVRQAIDEAIISSSAALQRKLVDHVVDVDGLRDLLKAELGGESNIVHAYGLPEQQEIDLANPFSILMTMMRKPAVSDKPAVAIVYVEGTIIDGHGGESLFGGGGMVGSEDIREAMRLARRDANVKAIVVRIDSPGGSAVASEAMYQAIRRAAAEKPVIVSIGSVAASGGYYVACASDHIIAERSAIVGSIGVVGGKLVLKGLYDWAGVTTETFARGQNAELFSDTQAFSDRQRRMLTTWMKNTYDQFTERVMATRKGKIADIDKVARGRIFLASEARTSGMVDEFGGIQKAIDTAVARAGMKPGEYEVRPLPAPKTLADLFSGGGTQGALPVKPMSASLPPQLAPMLMALPEAELRSLAHQAALVRMLQKQPVLLVAPYTITVK